MKKVMGLIILTFLMCVTVCFAADLSAEVKIGSAVIENGTSISADDAKSQTLSVSGVYESGAFVSVEVKNKQTGASVLYSQGGCDSNGAYDIKAIMSDSVTEGEYALIIGATGLENAKTYSFTIGAAAVKPTAEVVVSVSGGKATIKNGETVIATDVATSTAAYEIGTKLTFTAEPEDEQKTFLYWQDTNSKAILSTNETIDIVVGSKGGFIAVYADKAAAYVTFKSNGLIVAAGAGITVPNNPYVSGYTFAGWYVGDKKVDISAGEMVDVSENTTYVAGFNLNETKYTVKAEGAKASVDGSYKYNDRITVLPADKDSMVFTYWSRTDKDGANEMIVSYNKNYSFCVDGDTYIKANYASSAADKQIVLAMSNPVMADATRISFYAERNVPSKYTVIENGILISSSADFDINTSGVIIAKSRSTALNGKYTVRKAKVSAGQTWYAKAYLIYSDGANIYTAYSNVVSKTVE